jgi:hypothetical protein
LPRSPFVSHRSNWTLERVGPFLTVHRHVGATLQEKCHMSHAAPE